MALDVGGFGQAGYFDFMTWDKTAEQKSGVTPLDGFLLQRARLNVRGQVTRYFNAFFEVELAGGTASLQDAYVESKPLQALQVRIGQFLVPFLQTYQFNEVNTSFLDREIYVPQTQLRHPLRFLQPRDIGGMISGTVGNLSPASTRPVFEYGVGVFNGQGSNNPIHENTAFLYAARLQLHVLGYPEGRIYESDFARNTTPRVSVALGGMMNCDDESNWDRGFTTDAELRWHGLYASASFVWMKASGASGPGNGVAGGLSYSTNCKGGNTPAYLGNGGHFQVQYLLPYLAIRQGGGFEVLARFDQVSPYNAPTSFLGTSVPAEGGHPLPTSGDGNVDDLPSRWRITVGVNWFPLGMYAIHVSANFQFIQMTTPIPVQQDVLASLQEGVFWIQATAGI